MEEPRRKKVLIGCVAPDDPVSERGERPIATAVRALQPDRVDLIYSPTTGEAYERINSYLWMELGIRDRHPWFLNIENPTRYEFLVAPLVNVLGGIKNSLSNEDVEFHIVESGAPQMRTILLLAAVSRMIEATVWHVDDPSPGQAEIAEAPEAEREQARQRLVQVDLSHFEGAAIRFFKNIRLHLQVITRAEGEPEIHCEIVPERWLNRDPRAGPLKLLLELCKARRGEAYGVKQIGGWVQTRRLNDKYRWNPDARSLARRALNEEVAAFDLGELSIPELIEARGTTRTREYRVSLEPEEILIEYKQILESTD